MRVRRPTASSTWLSATVAVKAACGVASTARAGSLRAATSDIRPATMRVAAHSSRTAPRPSRKDAPRRDMRSQPPGGTRISAPTAIASPPRNGCSPIRGRCVRETATTRAGAPHPGACARVRDRGAPRRRRRATWPRPSAPRAASLSGPSSAPGASGRRPDALAQVLGGEARLAQRDQLALDVGVGTRPRRPAARGCTRLLPRTLSGALAARSWARSSATLSRSAPPTTSLTSPQRQRRARVDVAGGEEQLARARLADGVQEAPQAGVGVDEPELGGRHPEQDRVGRDAQVAGERELEAAADGVARQRGERRDLARVERLERRGEGVRDEASRPPRRRRRRGCRRCRSPRRTCRRCR